MEDKIIINNNFETHSDLTVNVSGQEKIAELKNDLEEANHQIDRLSSQFENARREAERLRAELREFKEAEGIRTLEKELEKFQDTAIEAEYEFENWLKSVNLANDHGYAAYGIKQLVEQVREGEKTVNQAIYQIKSNYEHLMEDLYHESEGTFDTGLLRSFLSTLESIGKTVKDVSNRLINMEENGVRALGGVVSDSGVGDVPKTLEAVTNIINKLSDDAKAAYEPLSDLIKSLTDFANVDETRLLGVSQAFRNIADIRQGSLSEKSVDNIIRLTRELQSVSSSGGGSMRFDFTGFSDLKISKSSLNNLATYLPIIDKVDVANLERLSRIDLTNFNNIKVGKSSIENLKSLISEIRQSESSTANDALSGVENNVLVNSFSQSMGELRTDIAGVTNEIKKLTAEFSGSGIVNTLNAVTSAVNNISEALSEQEGASDSAGKSASNYKKVLKELGNEKIASNIAQVKDKYEKQFNTGNDVLGNVGPEIERLSELKNGMDEIASHISGGKLSKRDRRQLNVYYKEYLSILERVRNELSIISSQENTLFKIDKGLHDDWSIITDVEKIREKYNNVINPSKEIESNYQNLESQFTRLKSATSDEEKVGAYKELLRYMKALNVQLGIRISKEREINREAGNQSKYNLDVDVGNTKSKIDKIKDNFSLLKESINPEKYKEISDEIGDLNNLFNLFSDKNKSVEERAAYLDEVSVRLGALTNKINLYNSAQERSINLGKKINKINAGLYDDESIQSQIDKITDKYNNISSPTETIMSNYTKMVDQFKVLKGATSDEEKISAYEKLLTYIRALNVQLGIRISKEKHLFQLNKKESNYSYNIKTGATQYKVNKALSEYESLSESNVSRELSSNMKELKNQFAVFSGTGDIGTREQALKRINALLPTINAQLREAKQIEEDISRVNFDQLIGNTESKVADIRSRFARLDKEIDSDNYLKISGNINMMDRLFGEFSDDSTSLQRKKEILAQLAPLFAALTKQIQNYSNAQKDSAKADAETEKAQKRKESVNKKYFTLLSQMENAERTWTSAKHGPGSEAYSTLQNDIKALRVLRSEYENGTLDVEEFSKKIDGLSGSFKQNEAVIKSAGKNTKSFFDRVGALSEKFATWFSITRVITLVTRSIRDMVQNTMDIDNAMNQFQIVTKSTDSAMREFSETALQTSKAIGSTVTDLMSGATTYARLGYNMQESLDLAKYTSMMSNIGAIDVSKAQDAITSIIKAYNLGVNDIESIMDKLVTVGNGFPISLDQIADGMTNASSALQAAGNSFEQSVALLTSANTTLQNSSKASTGLRTIAARIRNTKTDLDDLGEAMTDSDYDKVVQGLTHLNVSLKDSNGEFRSTYDIIKDIAAQWDNMSSMEQAGIAETLAGTRQQAVFYSLVGNFKEATDSMKAMGKSAGELNNSYSVFLESSQAKMGQLKTTFESLSQTVVNSDFLKSLIDSGTNLLGLLNDILKTTGTFPALLTVLTTYTSVFQNFGIFQTIKTDTDKATDSLTLFGKSFSHIAEDISKNENGFKGFMQSVFGGLTSGNGITKSEAKVILPLINQLNEGKISAEDFDQAIAGMSSTAQQMAKGVQSGTVALESLEAAANSSKFAMVGAKVAAVALNLAVSIGVSLLASWISSLINASKEAARRAQEAAEEAKKFKESLEDIDEYKTKINELVDAINDDSTSQSDALTKRKELLKIQEELIKKYGLEKEVVEGITGALEGEKNALDGVSKSYAKDYLDKHRQEIADAEKFLNETQDFYIQWSGKDSTGHTMVHTKDDFDRSNEHGWNNLSKYGSWEQYQLEPTYIIRQWMQETGKAFFQKGSFGSDAFKIHFKGTQSEILKSYKEFRSYIEEFVETNNNRLSDEQKKLYDELLTNISNSINYIEDGDNNDNRYFNEKTVAQNAAKLAVISDDNLSKLYNSYQESQEKYKDALAQGDQDLINQAYQDVNSAYAELLSSITDDVNGVQQATIQDWIKSLQEEFNNATDNTPLIVDVKAELNTDDSIVNQIIKEINNRGLSGTAVQTIVEEGKQNPEALSNEDKALWESINQYVETYNYVARYMGLAEKSVEDFIEALLQLGLVQKDVANQDPADFNLSKYRDSLDSLSDSLSKLKSARDKYMKGTLSDEELFKLIYDKDNGFPELANYINDIGTGLKVIADSKVDEVLKELEEVDVDGLTDEGLATYNRLINYLNDIKSGFDDASAAQEKFRSAMSETSSTIKTLVSMREEIEKNGKLSRDSVLTLLSDDKYRSVWNSLVDNNIAGYTKAINDLIKKEEGEFNALAKNILRSESEHAINEKKQEIDEFEKLYQIDLSNWENLSEDKKKELINTDAELLAKQKKLINEFNDTYKTDILQYKNSLEAKEALYAEHKAKMLKQAFNEYVGENGITVSNGEIHVPAYEGNFTSDEYKEFNTFLKDNLGITVQDYLAWVKNGKSIDDLIKGKIGNDYEAAKKAYDELLKELGLSNPYDELEFDINNYLDDKSQSASSETKQTLDWIERRLKKFAQTTKEVYADVEKYTDFTGKNSQLNKSISAIKDEIQANTDAYNAYLSAANAVSLDESYKSKVRNGTLNIETIKDADLRDKISQYQDLYDKAQSCKDTIESLKKTEKEYASQQLSNIEKYYSDRQKQAQNNLSYYNSADTDNLYIVKNYGGIRDSYKQQIQESENEAAQLQATLNDLTARGLINTDEWNEWNDKIVQCNLNTKNLKKSLRDLADEELNDISNKWENRNSLLEEENNYLSAVADNSFQKKSKDYAGLRKNYAQQIKNENASAIELQNRFNQAVTNGEIEKYSKKWYEWTNKINDSREKSIKLEQSLHGLYVEELNDIKNLHDANIGLLDSQLEREKLRNDNNSKKGNYWDVEFDYLEKSSEIAKQKRKELLNERAEIVKKFEEAKKQGLEEGSEAWNQFVSAINDADEALLNVDNDTKEIANAIRDLPINKLEHILEVISKIRGVIEGIQSLHQAQGFDRTANEIYGSINASGVEMQKAKEEADAIYQKMLAGEYGEVGSAEYQEAEGQLLDLMKKVYDYQIEQEQEYDKLIDLSIDKLNKQKEEMQEQNTALEKRLSLEKAILALENAKYQKNKLVYHEGVGFVYEADQNAVRDAQEQLDSQYRQSVLDYFDRAVKALEEYKKFNNIYDYSGNNLTDLALSDANLHFDPSKFTDINTESGFLYKNQKSYLDPEVAKLYHSMFSNISIPQEYYDSSASLAKSAEKISSNFANIQAGDTIQLTIGKDAINLSGVNDTNKLAQAIINEFPTQFVQALARKKK